MVIIVKTVEHGWARGLGRAWFEGEGSNERTSETKDGEGMKDWLFVKDRGQ